MVRWDDVDLWKQLMRPNINYRAPLLRVGEGAITVRDVYTATSVCRSRNALCASYEYMITRGAQKPMIFLLRQFIFRP